MIRSMEKDVTAGGIPRDRHRRQLREEPSMSRGDGDLVHAMHGHLQRCFPGWEGPVLHERISPTVHLDVMVVGPTADYPCLRLVTCGMAELPMHVPSGWATTSHAEVTIALPPSWPAVHAGLPAVRELDRAADDRPARVRGVRRRPRPVGSHPRRAAALRGGAGGQAPARPAGAAGPDQGLRPHRCSRSAPAESRPREARGTWVGRNASSVTSTGASATCRLKRRPGRLTCHLA